MARPSIFYFFFPCLTGMGTHPILNSYGNEFYLNYSNPEQPKVVSIINLICNTSHVGKPLFQFIEENPASYFIMNYTDSTACPRGRNGFTDGFELKNKISFSISMSLIDWSVTFLVACTRLYNPLCPLVGWLVGRSVDRLVTLYFFL